MYNKWSSEIIEWLVCSDDGVVVNDIFDSVHASPYGCISMYLILS